jgi:LAS superfamily LD-carboxypeptidase LdcB
MSQLDHWAYQVETPFLATHEWLDETSTTGWQETPDQVAFRESVLRAAIARKKKSEDEQRDLRATELRTVPGTRLAMRADAAEAAGRLLAAANQDLAEAQRTGDPDAANTISLTGASGYRSFADQQRVWRHHFGGYYQRTAAARASLAGGPHGPAAVAYMFDTFKISWKVAAPGFSNHQNGIAIDFQQVRKKGHPVRNSTTDAAKRIWLATWFHGWLLRRAGSFGFSPYEKEPWHWEFRGPGDAAPRPLTAAEIDRLVEARTDGETPAAWDAGEDAVAAFAVKAL